MIFLLWVLPTSAQGAFPTAVQSADDTKKQTARFIQRAGRVLRIDAISHLIEPACN